MSDEGQVDVVPHSTTRASGRRALRRSVGPVAWTVLEVMAERAVQDDAGDAIADVSIRSIADELDVDENTVERAVRRLLLDGHVVLPTPVDRSPKQTHDSANRPPGHEQLKLLSND